MGLLAQPRPADVLDAMVYYLVDTPDGSLGVLDGWDRDENGRLQALSVAQGWFGRRRFEIPIETLLQIDHERRRIVLARGAAPLEPKGPLRRLLEFGQSKSAEETRAAHARTPGQTRPVLCGVADERLAPTVVAVAARLARKLAAPLILTHVTPAHVPPGVSAAPQGQARLRDEERSDAGELLDALLSGAVLGTDVRRVIARGASAETLEELADREDAQLLVIGSTGKGTLGTLPTGSVSHHVLAHAPCPIVVVPPGLALRPHGEEDDETVIDRAGFGRANW